MMARGDCLWSKARRRISSSSRWRTSRPTADAGRSTIKSGTICYKMFERFGEDGYRVLGVASREMGRSHSDAVIRTKLTFAGFADARTHTSQTEEWRLV